MSAPLSSLSADGIEVILDLEVGHIRSLRLERDGRDLTPLHTAPWVEDATIRADADIPPVLRSLSGDFFCAPFATADIEPAPLHGWTANSAWSEVERRKIPGGATATFRLARPVMGAVVEKTLTVRDGHPFLYKVHAFVGGKGAIPVANHAMTNLSDGDILSFSRKLRAETPREPLETNPALGRSVLAYPQISPHPWQLALADGGKADIRTYPLAQRHEDVAILIEAPGNELGWFAAVRRKRGDMFISLKHPEDYPVTILWFSNGGRDYPPWNGRHLGVLGVEEGRTYAGYGHAASSRANCWADQGVATALSLNPYGRVEVRNIIGGLPLPAGRSAGVSQVLPHDGRLRIEFDGGGSTEVAFDTGFLSRPRRAPSEAT